MKHHKPVRIISSGKYLPEKVSSAALEERNQGIPLGFAIQRSGVHFRCQASFETNGYMGARAIESALDKADLSLNDLDLLISAGATYDYPIPSQSSVIKEALKDGDQCHLPTFDIDSTCLSFVNAFDVAARMLDGSQYRRIVLVSSEISSKGLSPRNPETFTLFGDGAVALILEFNQEKDSSFLGARFRTYSEGLYHSIIRGGGLVHDFKAYPYDEQLHSFEMNGIKMMKLARQRLPEFMQEFLDNLSIDMADIDVIIPHQASKAGIQLFKQIFSLNHQQVRENIEEYGNCIAASIPLLLHDSIVNNEVKRGDLCLLFGTSAGFSIGGLVFKY
jgi:3-oxoacyl-[acyl-carrier-protein] synthase III